jgi:mannose-6-phosphate isomerase-like protein (cupin superfamily)
MMAIKVSKEDRKLIDLGTKKIFQYNLPTKILSVSYMKVNGRNPEGNKVVLEKDCSFAIYITKGSGKFIIDRENIKAEVDDVIFVRAGSTFVAEGNFEYITFVVPAYHPESTEEVDI